MCFCILSLSIIHDHLTFLVDCDHQSLMSATMSLERVAPRMSCLRSAGCSSRTGAKKDMHLSPRPETKPFPPPRWERCGTKRGQMWQARWGARGSLEWAGTRITRGPVQQEALRSRWQMFPRLPHRRLSRNATTCWTTAPWLAPLLLGQFWPCVSVQLWHLLVSALVKKC